MAAAALAATAMLKLSIISPNTSFGDMTTYVCMYSVVGQIN